MDRENIWGTFDDVVFKEICGSSGVFAMFRKYDFQNAASPHFSIKLFIDVVAVHKKVMSWNLEV